MASLAKPTSSYKVYQTMFRVIKESETVDSRQHCFLLQSSPPHTAPRYLSVETRQELLRIENSWNATIITSVIKLGVSTISTFRVEFQVQKNINALNCHLTAENICGFSFGPKRWFNDRLAVWIFSH